MSADRDSQVRPLQATLQLIEQRLGHGAAKPTLEQPAPTVDSTLDRLASKLQNLTKGASKTTKESPELRSPNSLIEKRLRDDRFGSIFGELEKRVKQDKEEREAVTEGHRAESSAIADDLLSRSKDSQIVKDYPVHGPPKVETLPQKYILDLPRDRISLLPSKDISQYFAEEKQKIIRKAKLEVQRVEFKVKNLPPKNPRLLETGTMKKLTDLKRRILQDFRPAVEYGSAQRPQFSHNRHQTDHIPEYGTERPRMNHSASLSGMLHRLENLNHSSSAKKIGHFHSNSNSKLQGRSNLHSRSNLRLLSSTNAK